MRSGLIAAWLLLSALWAQALSPGKPMAQQDQAPQTPPPFDLPFELPHLSERMVIDVWRMCAGVLPLTREVLEHLAHPTPQGAQDALRSQVEAAVKYDYALALMEAERQRQLTMMRDEGFEPQSQGDILKSLALAYGIWIPQDGLPPGYDLFAAAGNPPPAVLAKLKQLIAWYHHFACGG